MTEAKKCICLEQDKALGTLPCVIGSGARDNCKTIQLTALLVAGVHGKREQKDGSAAN